jgi:hypothetical protein
MKCTHPMNLRDVKTIQNSQGDVKYFVCSQCGQLIHIMTFLDILKPDTEDKEIKKDCNCISCQIWRQPHMKNSLPEMN